MKEKLIAFKNGFMCFLFVWISSTPYVMPYLGEENYGGTVCPDLFHGGYVPWRCSRIPHTSCTYECYIGYLVNSTITQLTCQENGLWDADTNSLCIQSGESTSATSASPFFAPKSTGGRYESLALGISIGVGILMLIIVIIIGCVRWCHIRKTQRGIPGQADTDSRYFRQREYPVQRVTNTQYPASNGVADSRYFRPREYPGQRVTNTRQYPASNGVNGVSSFEPASYDRQQIPTISGSFKCHEPPPLYSEIHTAPNESPPTYKEVVTDPSKFNLDIELPVFNGQQ